MIITWRGLGILVPIFCLLGVLPAILIKAIAGADHTNPSVTGIGMLLVCGTLWPWGRKLNSEGTNHSFMFIPMQYWGIIIPAFVVVGMIVSLTH